MSAATAAIFRGIPYHGVVSFPALQRYTQLPGAVWLGGERLDLNYKTIPFIALNGIFMFSFLVIVACSFQHT